MQYARVQPQIDPLLFKPSSLAEDKEYWASFKNAVFIKNYAPVTDIDFGLSTPSRFSVVSGTRIQLFTPKTGRVVKTISRFKEPARCGNIRHDGKLLVAGDNSGLVQVFDLASRAILRSIKDHQQPVYKALFSNHAGSAPQILTCSDDTTARTFDLSTAQPLSTFEGHDDYVRTGSFLPTNPNLYLTGAYDTTVRLWDAREATASSNTRTLSHGYPVECVLVHPSGSIAISAGGPLIKIWDLLSGSTRPLQALSNHQKTVTSLAWSNPPPSSSNNPSRLLSAGFDGLVKSYDAQDGNWRVRHTMRYGFQISSMAMHPTQDSTLVVGGTDGTLAIRSKPTIKPLSSASRRVKALAAAKKEAENTIDVDMNDKDAAVEVTFRSDKTAAGKKKKGPPALKLWDRHLKAFRYAEALDAALGDADSGSNGTSPKYVVAVLNELKKIDGLEQALGGRTDVELLRILRFFLKTINDPRYGIYISEFCLVLIDLYDKVLGQSPVIDRQFQDLHRRVTEEVSFHSELMKMKGCLEMVFAASAV